MAHALAMPFHSMSCIWRRYEGQVAKRPLATNMATSACLWAAGDVLTQRLQRQPLKLSGLRKTAMIAAFGGLVFGPMGYAWYSWLDVAAGCLGSSTCARVILAKVLADNTIWSAVYVGLFMAYSSMVINRAGLRETKERLKRDFWPTMAIYMVVWPPIMAAVFLRVPIHHQLLAVNLLTVTDAFFLSWMENKDIREMMSSCRNALGLGSPETEDEETSCSSSSWEAFTTSLKGSN